MLFWFRLWHARLRIGVRPDLAGAAGILFVVYAAIFYPLLGLAAGHIYPAVPKFGITPCPLTIFTLGILLLARPAPPILLIVPVIWSLIGGTAAFLPQVPQDWPLLLSSPLTVVLLWRAAQLAERG